MSALDYSQILQQIYQRTSFGIHRGLDRMQKAVEILNHPEKDFFSIQIAGTNGKGSTAKMLSEILTREGYQVGLTISPHVLDYRERIQVNQQWISEAQLIETHQELKQKLKDLPLTFYEWTILMALRYFSKQKVDLVILETGLGGRWDATTIAQAKLTAITSISLDHQEILGESLPEILTEKMQIITHDSVCVTGIDDEELKDQLINFSKNLTAKIVFLDQTQLVKKSASFSYQDLIDITPSLKGDYQISNACLAIELAKNLAGFGFKISNQSIKTGIENTFWPARLEVVKENPKIIIDAAHNIEGISKLVAEIKKEKIPDLKIYFSCLNNRPYQEMLTQLFSISQKIYLVCFENDKAYSKLEWEKIKKDLNTNRIKDILTIDQSKKQLSHLLNNECVLICGSIYFISILRKFLLEDQ